MNMATKSVIYELRTKSGLSQEELAEKVFVTRQAVSRWENGETTPNTETLKLLSKLFDVSINTLLDDTTISKETDGIFNEEYCKWCYADGEFTYDSLDDLIDYCANHLSDQHHSPEKLREELRHSLPKLNYWKRYADLGGEEQFQAFKAQLIDEINALQIEGMPKLESLNALVGGYVNLEYRLPGGSTVKFLDDQATYLGNQLESLFGGDRCFGVVANMDFILICTYGWDGENPELVLYKKR